jgi:glyoxalase family protein
MTTTPPTATRPIAGLHHVTAITADVQANADFYAGILGLRMVKVTINYDEPTTYHTYFGDTVGRPGTAMTFFGWPGRRGSRGTGQATETAFTIPTGAAEWWYNHLGAKRVPSLERGTRFGASVLTFQDPDGLPLALVEAPDASDVHLFAQGGVPAEVAIRGFHSVTLTETVETAPARVLVNLFGYKETGREGNRVRYEAQGDPKATTGRVVDVLLQPELGPARGGTGTVHHVAFRTPDDTQQAAWLDALRRAHLNVSPVMDRDYFHSIYFREPGNVLFEIATDGPGFTLNEPVEALGTKVQLPGWLEPHRAEVERGLMPLKLAEPLAEVATA